MIPSHANHARLDFWYAKENPFNLHINNENGTYKKTIMLMFQKKNVKRLIKGNVHERGRHAIVVILVLINDKENIVVMYSTLCNMALVMISFTIAILFTYICWHSSLLYIRQKSRIVYIHQRLFILQPFSFDTCK